jgi:hypothetical protein
MLKFSMLNLCYNGVRFSGLFRPEKSGFPDFGVRFPGLFSPVCASALQALIAKFASSDASLLIALTLKFPTACLPKFVQFMLCPVKSLSFILQIPAFTLSRKFSIIFSHFFLDNSFTLSYTHAVEQPAVGTARARVDSPSASIAFLLSRAFLDSPPGKAHFISP